MSDNEKKVHKFSTTMDDFVRFLVAKTDDAKCPGCGSKSWTIIGSDETEMAYRLTSTMRDGAKPTYLNVFGIYCNECGLIRHHLARKVKAWANENPEQEQLELDEISEDDLE
ncbi:hypothetical protein FBY06_1448 [Pseudomonas sp. SJZ085]|uniref:hypothetical protein n=1 Tax=unclassified Pseudomonas TaxID=196821 RepID=UPI00119A6388|nr:MULTISPECIES: hypothetical protein [unclassified Pseudomonas]TWC11419.1 hypothetical protein FBX99_1448 [Pseudomonas sp. SJZ074]TWC30021.1 hypothetical protein FBY06_1448 [Pseudomonas sp. SJZ085]